MERATLYAQGTIWTHGDGLAMVVSNSAYNAGSATVNCLPVARKQQGACVPMQMDKAVYVLCEQLVTVPVKELAAFRGVASAAALGAVQGKLKAQLGIVDRYENVWAAEDDEPYREELTDLRDRVQRVEEAARHEEEAEAPEPAAEAPAAEQPKRRGRKKAEAAAKQPRKNAAPKAEKKAAPKAAKKAAPAAKQPRAKYSAEDIAYILDTANSISDVVAKYGFRNKNAAYMVRSRLKKAQAKAGA